MDSVPRSDASVTDLAASMEALRSGGHLTDEGLAALASVMGVDAGLVARLTARRSLPHRPT